jgi:hypothetical protein
MQAIMETIFETIYLITAITIGIILIVKSNKKLVPLLFGISAIVLGVGDAFHLIPRMYGLDVVGLENIVYALGIGKLITSITMTFFYVLLYFVLVVRYPEQNKKYLTPTIIGLAIVRIILCSFPQNMWTSADAPLSWGIYRNIPFVIIGIIMVIFFYKNAKANDDKTLKYMWLAILLSFAFYIPVVLFASTYSWVGMLMIPKTVCYIWIIIMGFRTLKTSSTTLSTK